MKICRALIVLLCMFSLPVHAASITLASTWKVLTVSDEEGVFADLFQIDDDVSLVTTFETTTPDVDPLADRGQYDGAVTDMVITAGTSVFTGTGGIVTRKFPWAYVFIQHVDVTTPSLNNGFTFHSSTDLTPQPSAALEWMEGVPSRVDSSSASLYFGSATVVFVQVGNYELVEVPVPGALLLFNTALAGFAGWRRFARRR